MWPWLGFAVPLSSPPARVGRWCAFFCAIFPVRGEKPNKLLFGRRFRQGVVPYGVLQVPIASFTLSGVEGASRGLSVCLIRGVGLGAVAVEIGGMFFFGYDFEHYEELHRFQQCDR